MTTILISFFLCLVMPCLVFAQQAIPIKAVTASTHQEPNRPINTLDIPIPGTEVDPTRWSAESTTAAPRPWVQYEFDGEWCVTMAILDWWQSDSRTSKFLVEQSADGNTWTIAFDGESNAAAGPSSYFFPLPNGACPETLARFVRITGRGNSKNNWNSLLSAIFYPGDRIQPFHFWGDIVTSSGGPVSNDPEQQMDNPVNDFNIQSSWAMTANDWIDITLVPYNVSTDGTIPDTVYTHCIGVAWKEPNVAFRIDHILNDVATPFVQATSGLAETFQVYPVDTAVNQGEPLDAYFTSFHVVPLADAHLAETLFFYDCNPADQRSYASYVAASTFQTASGYNAPGNIIDGNPATRWSALGDGQTIEFQVPYDLYTQVGVQPMNGTSRVSKFDISMSLDGWRWFPVLTNVQSAKDAGVVWYPFPLPIFGGFFRLTGHGNTTNVWNSYLEVQFGAP